MEAVLALSERCCGEDRAYRGGDESPALLWNPRIEHKGQDICH